MISLGTERDRRRVARKLRIDKARLRDLDSDMLVEFAAWLVRTGHPIETVARGLEITEDKIAEERSRQERYPDKLVKFAACLVRTGYPIETVAKILGIAEDKIVEERLRKERYDAATRAMGATTRHLMEYPPS